MNKEIIIALDYPSMSEALALVDRLDHKGAWVKVGMELFYSAGVGIIPELKKRDLKVFLDLKLHDIPHTMEQSLRALLHYDIDMVNVHCLAGEQALRAVAQVKNQLRPSCLLIGVTVLTSHDEKDWEGLQMVGGVAHSARHLARLAYHCGLDGVVCSAMEARSIKDNTRDSFLTVTPGIRLLGDSNQDQKRVMTPELAIKNGADFLVIGRSITESDDPKKTFITIKKSIL